MGNPQQIGGLNHIHSTFDGGFQWEITEFPPQSPPTRPERPELLAVLAAIAMALPSDELIGKHLESHNFRESTFCPS